jgi:TonB family protein
MLHQLPIRNVQLSPCSVAAEQLTPAPGGHYCASCQRPVHDFTESTAAELAQARAASPDGRLCGRFRLSQLAPESRPPQLQLRPRLRQFLLAAVLVLVQGLSARQAWAQAQQRPVVPFRPATEALYQLPGSMPLPTAASPDTTTPSRKLAVEETWVGMYVEQMPQPKGGQEGLMKFLRKEARYPVEAMRSGLEGKVFVGFTVTSTGQVTGAHIVKGLDPLLDAEALRLIRLMPPWTPGEQNNRPVDVQYTLPITFTNDGEAPPKKRRP